MKRLNVRLLSVVCMSVALCTGIMAQSRISDYLFLGGSGGYSTLLGKVSEMDVPGRLNAEVKVGYELRKGNFLFRLPVEFHYFSSKSNTDLVMEDVRIKDTRLGDAWMHYQMNSPLKETQRFFMPAFGFEFGYSGNDYQDCRISGSFYILGGLKFYHKLDIDNKVNLSYSTTATYDRYIDDYEDMPNHFYDRHESSGKEIFGTKIGGLASVELGWEFNVNDYDKLKVGALLNIGFTNIMYGIEREQCTPKVDDVTDVLVHSYYSSEDMKGKYVVPMMFGVAASYSWNMNRIYCRGRRHSGRCLPYRRIKHKRRR